MKNVFIAGGAGFVGSSLVDRLADYPSVKRMVVFDHWRDGRKGPERRDRFVAVRGEIQDLDRLSEAMKGCDTVFHFASNADVWKATQDPDIDFRQGTLLTRNVLEGVRLTGAKKIIYFSSSGLYGEHPDTDSFQVGFRENHGPCIPISPYAASKLSGEAMIGAYSSMFGIRGLVFRPANIVGPNQTHGVAQAFVKQLKEDPEHLRILGDGSQTKSYIHVDDMINAVLHAIDAQDSGRLTDFEVFNVASSDLLSVSQIAEMAISRFVPSDIKTKIEFTGGNRGWKGDIPVVRMNCDKIRYIGWAPRFTSGQATTLAIDGM